MFYRLVLFCSCCMFMGCGVVVGTAIDTVVNVATYPVKEYVFAGSYKYDNTWEEPYQTIETPHEHGEVLLGVAISGGGSRSAYFSACVLSELSQIPINPGSKRSYTDEADYVSGVSGGSLSSAYFCFKQHDPQHPQGKDFWPEFRAVMRSNFLRKAFINYTLYGIFALDFFTYYDRGDLMAGVWDDLIFHDATFADLQKAEKKGGPILIINGTSMNDGLKFVFSTLQDARFNESAFFKVIRDAGFIKYSVTAKSQPFQTVGFESIGSDISRYRLSKAIVASASVPNLLGPVTLKDYKTQETRLVNIVDGGVYDNYGVESLLQVMTSYLDKHPGTPAQIIVIDGSGYFGEDNRASDEYTVADYSMRPLEISWIRTKAYMEYVFKKAREFPGADGSYPYRNLQFHLISLYGISSSQDELCKEYGILPSQLPQEPTSKEVQVLYSILRPDKTTEDFFNKVTQIETSFALSDEDEKMIEEVAKKVTTEFRAKVSLCLPIPHTR